MAGGADLETGFGLFPSPAIAGEGEEGPLGRVKLALSLNYGCVIILTMRSRIISFRHSSALVLP
jgi:hypothetical protein